jgi:putative phosphoribosyl transferase
MGYANRQAAGQLLADKLKRFAGDDDVIVLALPRGGVVLGAEVAKELEAPLGPVLVRKISHPSSPEYAIGAVVEDEPPVYNKSETAYIHTSWLTQAEASARQLIERRRKLYYSQDLPPPDAAGKTVILVDDGIATGLTMEAAVRAVRNKHPKQIVVAVPVGSAESVVELEDLADEVVVLDKPESFRGAVGSHYAEFEQVDDEEVKELLWEANYDLRQSAAAHR